MSAPDQHSSAELPSLRPIGIVYSPFVEVAGTPIQSALARGAEGRVEIFPQFVEGLKDLDGFDRIWLIYAFDRAASPRLLITPFRDKVRRGVFATRAPCRPNPVGLSAVELMRIEGNVLYVRDLDVLDGTPLLDIKPYVPLFDRFEVRRSGWLDCPGVDRRLADDRFDRADDEPL